MENASIADEEVVRKVHRRRVWLWWVVANGLGAGLGGLLAAAAVQALTPSVSDVLAGSSSVFIPNPITIGAAITGMGLALAQWLVLYQLFRTADWRAGVGWIVLSTVAAVLAAWAGEVLFLLVLFSAALLGAGAGGGLTTLPGGIAGFLVIGGVFVLLAGGLGGLLVGSAQWLILRRYSQQAGIWIAANVLGWAGGLLLVTVLFLGDALGVAVGVFDTPIAGIVAAGAAMITGRPLLRLLEEWRPERRISGRTRGALFVVGGLLVILAACAGLNVLSGVLASTNQPDRAISLAWAPDSRHLAVADESGAIEFRDAMSGTVTARFPNPALTPPAIHWEASGQAVLVATQQEDHTLAILSLPGGQVRATLPLTVNVTNLTWSSNGRRVGIGLYNRRTEVEQAAAWDPASGLVTVTQAIGNVIYDMVWSPAGRWLALTGSYWPPNVNSRAAVFLWDPDDARSAAQPAMLLGAAQYDMDGLAWSPDGRFLASASSVGTTQVWDVARRAPMVVFQQGGRDVTLGEPVAWSPDGREIASSSANQTVQIWDAQTGRATATFGQSSAVRALAWSPDGWWLAAIGIDGLVRVWSVK